MTISKPLATACLLLSVGATLLGSLTCCSLPGESATSKSSLQTFAVPTRFTIPAGTQVWTGKGQATLPEDLPALSIEQHAAEVAAILLK